MARQILRLLRLPLVLGLLAVQAVWGAQEIRGMLPPIVTAKPSLGRAASASTPKPQASTRPAKNVHSKVAPRSYATHAKTTHSKAKGASSAAQTPPHHSIVVVLDPGHGGKDGGASGLHGAKEKNINLQIAKRVKFYLEKCPGFKVVLTRSNDRYYTRQQRVNVVRRHQAKLFISLHSDASSHRNIRGVTIFSLSPQGTASVASRWLTRADKKLVSAGEVEAKDRAVRHWLTDLSSRNISQESAAAGGAILRAVNRASKLHRSRIEYADFWVLKAPHVPSLLIETGFISNPEEAKLLMNANYRDRLARAIAEGIVHYFNN